MEIIKPGTNFDFLGRRKEALVFSAILVVVIWALVPFRLNFGVDFSGGTEIEVQFRQPVSAADVRRNVEAAGFADASVQQIGAEEENGFLVRVERVSILSAEQSGKVEATLQERLTPYGVRAIVIDPHVGDRIDIQTERPVPLEEMRAAVESVEGVLLRTGEEPVRDLTRAGNPSYQILLQGLSEKVSQALEAEFGADQVDVRRVEYVGPQVGEQLRNQGIMAVLLSMVAILLYVAFRFQPQFAPGGVIALFHDVTVVMGYYVFTGAEFNLTSIAVLLTIVGYSINDTIVIFDRVREIQRRKTGMSTYEILNLANNESLSRTIITSALTALSLLGLILFAGGTQLWDFAMAMLVGLVSGTYSTIFIAGPFGLWLDAWWQKRAERQKAIEAAIAASHPGAAQPTKAAGRKRRGKVPAE